MPPTTSDVPQLEQTGRLSRNDLPPTAGDDDKGYLRNGVTPGSTEPESFIDFLYSAETEEEAGAAGESTLVDSVVSRRKSTWSRIRSLSGWSGRTLGSGSAASRSQGQNQLELSGYSIEEEEEAIEAGQGQRHGHNPDEKVKIYAATAAAEESVIAPIVDAGGSISVPGCPPTALVISLDQHVFVQPRPDPRIRAPTDHRSPRPDPPSPPTVDITPSSAHLPTSPTTSQSTSPTRQKAWIAPLASAVLAPPLSPLGPRRSSDPALGANDRRRRELRVAAERLYADAQAQL